MAVGQQPTNTRTPSIGQARQPNTYQHRSPFTYNHRSPFTYNHRSPFTYQHRSPFTYQAQEPNIRSAQQPTIKDAQQPTIKNAQQPTIKNAQEPNIRTYQITANQRAPVNAQEPNIRNKQSPYIAVNQTSIQTPSIADAQEPNIRNQQEPNIRNTQTTVTYQHRSPTTYNHRSPFTYDHRSPFTYNHRSPFTYDHRSPFTYQHQSPYIANGQQPTIKNAQQPNIRNSQQPNIRNAQEPNIRNAQSPYTYNVQTPSITQSPLIYDAIDGDTTGPSGSSSGWGPSHSNQVWMTWQSRVQPQYQVQAFASMGFKYQTSSTTAPISGSTVNQDQGGVEVSWYGGTNGGWATVYYDFISLYDNGQNPTIDDTWAWDLKYDHTISGSSSTGLVNSYGSNNGSYTPNQSGGGNWTNGAWVALYSGSSSAGSYNGTVTQRYTQWLAQTASSGTGTATARSLGNNSYDVRITKSGQTTIYTNYTHGSVSCSATTGQSGPM